MSILYMDLFPNKISNTKKIAIHAAPSHIGSSGAQGGPVCKISPLILTLGPYFGPKGGLD